MSSAATSKLYKHRYTRHARFNLSLNSEERTRLSLKSGSLTMRQIIKNSALEGTRIKLAKQHAEKALLDQSPPLDSFEIAEMRNRFEAGTIRPEFQNGEPEAVAD